MHNNTLNELALRVDKNQLRKNKYHAERNKETFFVGDLLKYNLLRLKA